MTPGQRLIEGELATLFGVTRGGVRLAIDSLVGEGLVERVPNRGARVRRVSAAEAVEIAAIVFHEYRLWLRSGRPDGSLGGLERLVRSAHPTPQESDHEPRTAPAGGSRVASPPCGGTALPLLSACRTPIRDHK